MSQTLAGPPTCRRVPQFDEFQGPLNVTCWRHENAESMKAVQLQLRAVESYHPNSGELVNEQVPFGDLAAVPFGDLAAVPFGDLAALR